MQTAMYAVPLPGITIMRTQVLHSLAAVLLVLPSHSMPERLLVQPESKMWIEGTSSLKSFSCKVPEFSLEVTADSADAVAAVLAGRKAVRVVELAVPAAKIDCANSTMNEHMLKAIKADANKTVRFTLSGYDIAQSAKGAAGTMRGALLVGGAEHPVSVAAVASDAGNGALRIVGSYELALSAFALKAPTLMFGSIKVGDKVQVKFDVVLKK